MNKRTIVFLLILPIFILFFLSLLPINKQNGSSHQGKYLGLKSEALFSPAKELPPKKQNELFFIKGGIIPHHLLAGRLIEDFFTRLSHQKPKTIILLGPNHHELGKFRVISGLQDWPTRFGILKTNKDLVRKLNSHNLLRIKEEVLLNEHSILEIVPFIKQYLPNASVFPLILSGHMNLTEVETLAANLAKIADKDTVIIASVDFSHFLKAQDAYENDLKTLEIIKNFAYSQLLALDNDYLDSPPSLAVLLALMKETGSTNIKMLHQTNSGQIFNDTFAPTTSYFSIMFYSPPK